MELPTLLGGIFGKRIFIQATKNSLSYYYNYKESHNAVLLAVVDTECKFTCTDGAVMEE
jgi:hypothetical protein